MMSVAESVRMPEIMPITDKMTSPTIDIVIDCLSSPLFFTVPLFVLNVISIDEFYRTSYERDNVFPCIT